MAGMGTCLSVSIGRYGLEGICCHVHSILQRGIAAGIQIPLQLCNVSLLQHQTLQMLSALIPETTTLQTSNYNSQICTLNGHVRTQLLIVPLYLQSTSSGNTSFTDSLSEQQAMQQTHWRACQIGEALSSAIAHDDDAQVR